MAGNVLRQQELHELQRYREDKFPYASKMTINCPSTWDPVTNKYDYPRLRSYNAASDNKRYHLLGLRSTLMDSIFSSASSPRQLPRPPMPKNFSWVNPDRMDDAADLQTMLQEAEDNAQDILVVPIFKHKEVTQQHENLLLMMFVSCSGAVCVDPFQLETTKQIRQILKSTAVVKIVLNGPKEISHYLLLLDSPCRNLFCISSAFQEIVVHEEYDWNDFNDALEPMPKFHKLYDVEPVAVILDPENLPRHTEGSTISNVKCYELINYVYQFGKILFLMRPHAGCHAFKFNWLKTLFPLQGYLTKTFLFDRHFWLAITDAMSAGKYLHVYVPCFMMFYLDHPNGITKKIETGAVDYLYQTICNPEEPIADWQPVGWKHTASLTSFRDSMISEDAVNFSSTERYKVGSYNDIWSRLEFVSPSFVRE